MILVDLNQVMISNLMAQIHGRGDVDVSEDLLRHMVLNSIRSYNVKFKQQYGELVICCDDTNNWRKKLFPYYKAHRKQARDESTYDWPHIFNCLNTIRDELKQFFPYRVIQVNTAEADDVIGVLCHEFGVELGQSDPILILSGDKDFIQLQKFCNVDQYDPIRKRKVVHKDPFLYTLEHIIKGDRGDGIPNALSKDDVFVTGGRQKPMRQTTITKILDVVKPVNENWEAIDSKYEWSHGFHRNRKLIDLQYTPPEIKEQVLSQFYDQAGKERKDLFNFFITRKLNNLIENISEF